MPLWRHWKVENWYETGQADGAPADVRIDGDEIVVTYRHDGQHRRFQGRALAPGHFELRATSHDGLATLHQFPRGTILEGWWREGQLRGMWRINLGTAQDEEAD